MKYMGSNIQRRRKACGLTQQQLADKVGITQVYIAKLETGGYTPTLKTLGRIAKVLKTTASKLLE